MKKNQDEMARVDMLELAAKLAGIQGAVDWSSGEFMIYPDFYASWCPDTDTEAAYDLADKAGLSILRQPDGVEIRALSGVNSVALYSDHGHDRTGALRSAILDCAVKEQKRIEQRTCKR